MPPAATGGCPAGGSEVFGLGVWGPKLWGSLFLLIVFGFVASA